jgi:mRNA-degrading endonuclease RelE of RelBE toxin-antitoxin system
VKLQQPSSFQRSFWKWCVIRSASILTFGRDLESVIRKLEQGELSGDRLQGLPYRVYKVRVGSTDMQRGKSGGYRLIYYLQAEYRVVLLTIHAKSQFDVIPNSEILALITAYLDEHAAE